MQRYSMVLLRLLFCTSVVRICQSTVCHDVADGLDNNIHSRYMKTQHIKFEIPNERLSVFKYNLIQLNFVQNILVIGRICDAIFHLFGDVRDHVTRSLDVCHR